MADKRLRIRVVCAEAGRQTVLSLDVEDGCTAGEALQRSGILEIHPDVNANACGIGIFGQEVTHNYRLQDGDRLELLRPLQEDPRERRRRLAKQQGAAGKNSARGG